jgi:alpha/beta superfamily hydrolase
MGQFKIAIVDRGKEALWRNYWLHGASNGTPEEAPEGLGRTEVVEAPTLEAAIDFVQSQHPDCVVMLAGTEFHVA